MEVKSVGVARIMQTGQANKVYHSLECTDDTHTHVRLHAAHKKASLAP